MSDYLKDHTGKPSLKRKLAWRSFISAQIVGLFVLVISAVALITGKALQVPQMVENIFWSFLGASATFAGINITEYL